MRGLRVAGLWAVIACGCMVSPSLLTDGTRGLRANVLRAKGSIEMKLMIRIGRVIKISEDREPALIVTRIEYSTSRSLPRLIERAFGYNS